MGCFSIPTQKARKKMRDQSQLPECKPASLYDNKPTVLPHPREVEQGKYSRTLSTPFQFIDGGRSPSSMSPSIRKEPRALSAPGRVSMLDSYAHSTPTMTDYIQLPCSPLRNRIQPLSDPALCQKADGKTFGGRPVRLPSPLPLTGHPLPIPSSSVCQTSGQNSSSANLPLSSSKCSTLSREGNGKLFGGLRVSSSLQPKPLPPPPDETNPVASSPRLFTFIELAAGCQNFSPACCIGDTGAGLVYRSWIINERNPKKKTEASVMQITTTTILQDSRNFIVEATKLSSVQHPHLCKLIGFCVEDTPQLKGNSMKNKVHILVYEYLPNGTADKLLYGRQEGAPLDWSTRVKIALGAAKGLAYLHEHPSGQFADWLLIEPQNHFKRLLIAQLFLPGIHPSHDSLLQILYSDLSTFNIQIDQDFNAKLTGYGLVKACPTDLLQETAYIAPETAANGCISPKSNVWSFGIILLELLTGRQNLDAVFPAEEQDLVQWLTRFAADDNRLFLGIDPELKGRYPAPDVKLFASLALKCVHEEPDLRPSMKEVVETLAFLKSQCSARVRCSLEADAMENADKLNSLEQELLEANQQARSSGYLSSNSAALITRPQSQMHYSTGKIAWPSQNTNELCHYAFEIGSPKVKVHQQIHLPQSS